MDRDPLGLEAAPRQLARPTWNLRSSRREMEAPVRRVLSNGSVGDAIRQ